MSSLVIFCDAGVQPINPGGYGTCAFVVFEADVSISGARGARRPKPIHEQYACIGSGPGMTNNLCEYKAVVAALKWCVRHAKDREIQIRADSKLVVKQINGDWECGALHLQPICDEGKNLLAQLRLAKLIWIPRADNYVADALTRKAYAEYKAKNNT